jgi:hypothetical protein
VNPEELRRQLMADADKVTDSRILSLAIGREGVRRVRALRRYWEAATADDLARLVAMFEREP